MVKIRLARAGRKNQAYWKIGVFDSKTRRDGKPIEYLGSYNPHKEAVDQKVQIDRERTEYWLGQGAQPTETVASLLNKLNIPDED